MLRTCSCIEKKKNYFNTTIAFRSPSKKYSGNNCLVYELRSGLFLYMYIVHFLVQEQITVNKVIQKTHDNLIMTSPRQREFDFINCCSNLLVNLRTENVRAENCWVRADTVLDHNRLFEISKISIAYRLRLLRDSKLWLRNYQLVNFKPGLKVHFRFCVTVFKYSVDKNINY